MAQSQRNWGRTAPDEFGNQTWVEIVPDPQTGLLDLIYFAALAQTLRLNLNESPFYSNFGLPAQQSVLTQIPPDFYVQRTQAAYAPYFASLIISRAPPSNPPSPTPVYNAQAVVHSGLVLTASVPVAT
jgi:hypothetical protein